VFCLRSGLVVAGPIPEDVARRAAQGGDLEVPGAVVLEVGHRAVPTPVDGVELARDAVAVVVRLVPLVAPREIRIRAVHRKPVHLAIREAVAGQEVGGGIPEGVVPLAADVDARRADILRPHPVGPVRAGSIHGFLVGEHVILAAERAVVARNGYGDVLGAVRVELGRLLEAAHRRRPSVRGLRCDVDGVSREPNEARVGRNLLPLLVGEEDVVHEAVASAPHLLLHELRGAERHHRPVCLPLGHAAVCRRRIQRIIPVNVHVRLERSDRRWAGPVARPDELAPEVVGELDQLARALDHRRRGQGGGHEPGHHLPVVVHVLDVRARDRRRPVVDQVREGLLLGDGAVGLALHDDADGVVVVEYGPKPVRHADDQHASLVVHLADSGDRLQVSELEVDVAVLAVHHEELVALRVRGFGDAGGVLADGLQRGRVRLQRGGAAVGASAARPGEKRLARPLRVAVSRAGRADRRGGRRAGSGASGVAGARGGDGLAARRLQGVEVREVDVAGLVGEGVARVLGAGGGVSLGRPGAVAGQVGLPQQPLAAAVGVEVGDDALVLVVVGLQADEDDLVVHGDGRLDGPPLVARGGLRQREGAVAALRQQAGQVGHPRELVRVRSRVAVRRHPSARHHAGVHRPSGLRHELERLGRGALAVCEQGLVDEHALPVLVAAVLLDHGEDAVRRRDGLEAIDVLEGELARGVGAAALVGAVSGAVAHGGLVPAVRGLALDGFAEVDEVVNGGFALVQVVDGVQLGRERVLGASGGG